MKRIISLTLTTLLIACTPPQDSGSGEPSPMPPQPPIAEPVPKHVTTHANIKNVVDQINNNQISLDEGLQVIQGFVAEELNRDRPADEAATSESSAPSEAMQDLADAIFSIQQGDKIQNLAKILIKESYAGLDTNNPMITSLSTIGSLFQVLSQQKGLLPENLNSDEFLIYFLTLYKKSYNAANDTVLSDALTFEKVKSFFTERCQANLEKSKTNQTTTDIFKVYSGLLEIADQPEWLYQLFINNLDQIEIQNLKARHSTAYIQLLNHLISTDSQVSATMLTSTLAIAKKQISRIQFNNAFDSDVIDTFETTALLFDLHMEKYSVKTFQDWANLLDQKIYTFQSFEIQIRNALLAKKIKISDNFVFRHPYLQTYLQRAKNSKTSKTINQQLPLSTYLQNFSLALQNMGSVVSVDTEILTKSQSLAVESTVSSQMTAEAILKLEFAQRASDYRNLLTAVDVGRRYLEESLSFQFLQNTSLDRRDQRRVVYQSVKATMVDALCYRFAEHILANGFACDSYKNPSLSAYQKNQSYQSVDSVNNEVQATDLVQHIKYPRLTPIGAGIYVADTDVILEANSLTFHPLAMIYAPGKSITLKADQIYGAWIDVSADDRPEVSKVPPSGQMPFFHSYRGLKDATSYPGFSQCEFNGASYQGQVLSYPQDQRLMSDIIDYFPGSTPPKPESAQLGKSGGTIRITPYSTNMSVKTSHSNLLLTAMGGNGQPGYHGGDSPLCANNTYKTFEGGFCVAGEPFQREGYSMQYKTKKPEIPNMHFVDGGQGTYGLSGFIITKVMYIVDVAAGAGGDGGAGGSGGSITSDLMPTANTVALTMAGIEGRAGSGGACGPGPVQNGATGSIGQNGSVSFGN